MINILPPLLKSTVPAIQRGTIVAGTKVTEHIYKHGYKYVLAIVQAIILYKYGKAKGYIQGKKAGTAEQAQRDEVKFKKQHEQHENDRKSWNAEKQEYEDLLNEVKEKL